MSSEPARSRRRILLLGAAIVLVVAGAIGAYLALQRPGDVSNPKVEFRAEPTPQAPPPRPSAVATNRFEWPFYGYTRDRRRYLPAPDTLRPPFQQVWAHGGRVLLEFTPVLGGRMLFLLKNNGALVGMSKRTGHPRWRRKIGVLAAASPAYADGYVYAPLLQRDPGARGGRLVAVHAGNGKTVWSRPLPSRTESSPIVDHGRIYLGSENGTVYALRASDGSVIWTFRAAGAVKGGLALADGKLYFGDYGGQVHAIRASDGRAVWTASGAGRSLLGAGTFYSTPAVAYGRVYIGSTDGGVYSFSSATGQLAWRKETGGYVYGSPAVAQVPGGRPTVYVGSYSGRFYALDARTGDVRWSVDDHGKISGSATVIGDVVYISNLGRKSTVGFGARTGRRVFDIRAGAFNAVVSDGETIYLNGYSTLYALRPVPPAARRQARRDARHRRFLDRRNCERNSARLHHDPHRRALSRVRCLRRHGLRP